MVVESWDGSVFLTDEKTDLNPNIIFLISVGSSPKWVFYLRLVII